MKLKFRGNVPFLAAVMYLSASGFSVKQQQEYAGSRSVFH